MNNKNKRLPYIIFELANSHGGNESALLKDIEAYSKIKYEKKGIKFQVFKADLISLPDFQWYSVYKKLYFSIHKWKKIIDYASNIGDVWIDVFDLYGVRVVKNNLKKIHGLKLQASVIENYEVYEALNSLDLKAKKIIINFSGFDIKSIKNILLRFGYLTKKLILQIGFQSYPTKIKDTGLQKINILKSTYPNLSICIADHVDANEPFALIAPLYANFLGCDYIEKHFCRDRSKAVYDEYSAIEPDQMVQLCKLISDSISSSIGNFISNSEKLYFDKTIQVPVIKNFIPAGSILSLSDIVFRRTSQKGISWASIYNHQKLKKVTSLDLLPNKTIHDSIFRKAKVGTIIACRMKSKRLANKAILPIGGISSVERCLNQCLSFREVDEVILATSDLKEDKILANYLCHGKAKLWLGEADDVIARYLGACDYYKIDVIIRVTADCPFVLPEIIDFLLTSHFENGADYTVAKNFAVGTSAEIINTQALRKIKSIFGFAEYSEYMTWYFQNNPKHFKLNYVSLPPDLIRHYRLTLDYPEDLLMLNRIVEKSKNRNTYLGAKELFKILDQNPDISKLNAHLKLKYKTDKILINKLNEKTSIRNQQKIIYRSDL